MDIGDVDVTSLPALATGSNVVGQVYITNGTDTVEVDANGSMQTVTVDSNGDVLSYSPPVSTAVTPTLSTSPAYGVGDSMSTAALEFPSAAASSGGRGLLYSVTFIDKDNLDHDDTHGAYYLHVFSASVTPNTANSAYALADDTELATYVGTADTDSGSWISHGVGKTCTVHLVPPIVYYCASTSVYGALVAKTADSGVHTSSGVVVRAAYQPA